jgi:hypothetical protein
MVTFAAHPERCCASGPPEPDPKYRTKAAAHFLGVTPACLKKWRRVGKGPKFLRYDGSTVLYPLSELRHYLERSLVGPEWREAQNVVQITVAPADTPKGGAR